MAAGLSPLERSKLCLDRRYLGPRSSSARAVGSWPLGAGASRLLLGGWPLEPVTNRLNRQLDLIRERAAERPPAMRCVRTRYILTATLIVGVLTACGQASEAVSVTGEVVE